MLTLLDRALGEGIPSVAAQADTHGGVADDTALCVGSASTGTRVSTLLIHAGEMGTALAVTHTLGSTIRWRSDELG